MHIILSLNTMQEVYINGSKYIITGAGISDMGASLNKAGTLDDIELTNAENPNDKVVLSLGQNTKAITHDMLDPLLQLVGAR